MASAKLHIEGASGRPQAIKHYLDLIDRRDYDSAESVMEDAYVEFGLTRPSHDDRQVDIKNMTTTLAKLGLVAAGDHQSLTDLGEQFIDVIVYNEDMFYELLHLLYSTAYYRDPSPDTAISWSYFHISSALSHRAPIDFTPDTRQAIAEEVMQKADEADDEALTDHGPLSDRSLNNYKWFIKALDPVVLNESGNFQLRSFAKKELVLGAIDILYRSDIIFDTADYGDKLNLTEETKAILGPILLVDEPDFADVIEHTASMDGRLFITSDYELRIRLTEEVDINDLS
jgi:hypothetical protein